MPSPVAGQVGPAGTLPNGTVGQAYQQGRQAEEIVSELAPRYYTNAYQGNCFFAAHQAAITFAANGLTTSSAVGMCVYNPPTNGVNLVPMQCEVIMTSYVTSSTDVQVVAVVSSAFSATNPTTNTAITVYSAKGAGKFTSSALCAQSITFAANTVVWKQVYGAFVTTTVAAAIPTQSSSGILDIGGSLVIPPGFGMAFIANNASTGLVSVSWAEIPI
jgi:hypothetical protein